MDSATSYGNRHLLVGACPSYGEMADVVRKALPDTLKGKVSALVFSRVRFVLSSSAEALL